MNRNKNKLSALILFALILVIVVATLGTRAMKQRKVNRQPSPGATTTAVGLRTARTNKLEIIKTISAVANKAQQMIQALRASAMKVTDVQAFFLENAAKLHQLRMLGADAIPVCLAEIADKTSPSSLRILLIEMVTSMTGHGDERLGQALMTIITDPEEIKAVKIQALQWIPVAGNQSDGSTLLEMLPKQTDSDLEFGITRALKGFQVPGSVGILRAELADGKSYLIQVAAYHALAKQGGHAALTQLQDSVASRLATGSQENNPEENTVSLHGILALGEIPDASSVPILESAAKNPANSVSVRNTAIQTIATIGGSEATLFLRHALQKESNESVLVYVARAISIVGERTDASACLAKAATVSDSYTKTELQKAAKELQQK